MRPLPEETLCSELLTHADTWLSKLKKVLVSGTSVKKGTSLSQLLELYEESQTLSLNLENELRPLRLMLGRCLPEVNPPHPITPSRNCFFMCVSSIGRDIAANAAGWPRSRQTQTAVW